jgi:ATP-dependent RNA helicase RhlE
LRLVEPLMRAIEAAGYEEATPIQAAAIPHALTGRDVLGIAQTGTGKTAAFALPILQRLLEKPVEVVNGYRPTGARALVLSPTRELAQQVHESFQKYARFTSLRCVSVVGGVHQYSQTQALKAGVDVLVATPGRLIDLMEQRLVRLTFVEVVVLDEADRMLDIGFLPAIRRIVAHVPEDRQALMFTATMPRAIRTLAAEILRDPLHAQVTPVSSPAANVEHRVYHVEPAAKPALLAKLLREAGGGSVAADRGSRESAVTRVLVFARTKRGADRVSRELRRAGVRSIAMHGDREQSERTRALAAFRAGSTPVLVATDVAARGLHVDDIALVVNYDLPHEPETYVHRIGRTGRAGANGSAVSFCTSAERSYLRAIEKLIRRPLEPVGAAPSAARPAAFEESRPGAGDDSRAAPQRGDGLRSSRRRGRRRRGGRPSAAARSRGALVVAGQAD